MTISTLPPEAVEPAAPAEPARRVPRILRGPAEQPAWARSALLVLLAGTAVLYLWGLGASGNANSYYAAAVQAGTMSWKAMFFGSFDPSNFITVDKPPASLWVMALSGRVFGFSSWSMLAPQAIEGVAAVGFLYAAVRRWAGSAAGLFAGAALALTPVAALMFRYNNPDALLTLLLVIGAYCVVRATERAGTRWLLLAGTAVGFGFLTKMLQAFLVIPAFGLIYLVAAPTSLRRRLVQLLAAGGAVIASAGWWVAIVELWPASSRPYIGGSTTNSVLELTFGYNGLGRIFGGAGPGGSAGGPGGAGAGGSFGGATGITRMFADATGTQISWLLPAALVALGAGLWLTRHAPRTDRTRAALILWGSWLLVTAGVFSYMQGIFHPYYTVVLAPPIGAIVAITGRELWRQRRTWFARSALAVLVAGTGAWSYVLLGRDPNWHPELRYAIAAFAVVTAAALLVGARLLRRATVIAAVSAIVVSGAGSTAYALSTAATPHTGPIPSAGPAGSAAAGQQLGPGPGGGQPPAGALRPGVGQPRGAGQLPNGAQPPNGADTQAPGGAQVPGGRLGPGTGGEVTDSAVVALLRSTDSTWAAATVGAQGAASLQLSSGKAIMAIGGFSGGDATPSLAEFQQYVSTGKVHYFLGSGAGGGPAGSARTGSEITSWVQANFTAVTVGGQTIYDLTKPIAS
jgi:4-amino-4-deoxy-L-arabinose transferase-like glycosyltransferase